jgi:hypothetical protein
MFFANNLIYYILVDYINYVQDRSFTHQVERLLGKIILDKGYKIKGV